MQVHTIAVLHKDEPDLREEHVERIRRAVPGVTVVVAMSEDELLEKTGDAEVLLTWGQLHPVRFCQAAKSLRWIHTFTTGVDGILVPEITSLPIRLTATKGIHGSTMADHVLAFIFSFLRRFPRLARQQIGHVFRRAFDADEAEGKTVGIVGMGLIGREVARKCRAVGMRVVALRHRSPIPADLVDAVVDGEAGLAAFLGQLDFLVLALPYTPESHHMIGWPELTALKREAYLINVSRGGLVDTEALVRALREGVIQGAGLDAFEEEPLPPEHPLWDLPNVILTPHMAAITPRYMDRAIDVFLENLRRFVADEELLYQVDLVAGY